MCAIYGSILASFCLFSFLPHSNNNKTINNRIWSKHWNKRKWIWTQGCRIVRADWSTELWLTPSATASSFSSPNGWWLTAPSCEAWPRLQQRHQQQRQRKLHWPPGCQYPLNCQSSTLPLVSFIVTFGHLQIDFISMTVLLSSMDLNGWDQKCDKKEKLMKERQSRVVGPTAEQWTT